MEPLRSFGSWPALPDLPASDPPAASDPVAVMTLGRLRLTRLAPFLSTSGRAEREAVAHPALLAGTALARPPRIVATFSLWRTSAEMREYATGREPGGHAAAINAHHAKPFHHESVFARFRPYAALGQWDGRDPLAVVAADRPTDARP